jgi:hypothetical protein
MKFALLYYFYDPAQAGPASRASSATDLALDAEINEAGAHVYGAGFHPQSTAARTLSVSDGQASTEGTVA